MRTGYVRPGPFDGATLCLRVPTVPGRESGTLLFVSYIFNMLPKYAPSDFDDENYR